VERLGIPAPEFVWHSQTSSRRHFVIVHRLFIFRLLPFTISFRETKNPAYTG